MSPSIWHSLILLLHLVAAPLEPVYSSDPWARAWGCKTTHQLAGPRGSAGAGFRKPRGFPAGRTPRPGPCGWAAGRRRASQARVGAPTPIGPCCEGKVFDLITMSSTPTRVGFCAKAKHIVALLLSEKDATSLGLVDAVQKVVDQLGIKGLNGGPIDYIDELLEVAGPWAALPLGGLTTPAPRQIAGISAEDCISAGRDSPQLSTASGLHMPHISQAGVNSGTTVMSQPRVRPAAALGMAAAIGTHDGSVAKVPSLSHCNIF